MDEKIEKLIEKATKTLTELAPEWKDAIENASDEEILDKLGEVARNEQENLRMKAEDPHIKKLRGELSSASEQYRESTKANKAKLVYGDFVLNSRGK